MRRDVLRWVIRSEVPARVVLARGLLALVFVGGWGIPAATASAQEGTGAEVSEGEGAQSEPSGWIFEIDPAASSVDFELGATMHTVEGSATVTGGIVRFDPAAGTTSGRIEVDARSLDTDNDGRDEDMHTKVLESERYPEIFFEAERMSGDFSPAGASRVTVEGVFGIHGATHPMRLTFEVDAAGDSFEASTEFRVPYVEWGMKDPSKFLLRVDKHVTVRIEAVGTLTPVEPATTTGDGEADAATEAAADGRR